MERIQPFDAQKMAESALLFFFLSPGPPPLIFTLCEINMKESNRRILAYMSSFIVSLSCMFVVVKMVFPLLKNLLDQDTRIILILPGVLILWITFYLSVFLCRKFLVKLGLMTIDEAKVDYYTTGIDKIDNIKKNT